MSRIRVMSRRRLIRRFAATGRNYVEGAWEKALASAQEAGFVVNPRSFGLPAERVALVPLDDDLAAIITAVLKGPQGFQRERIEKAVGGPFDEISTLRRLADAGLGLLGLADDVVTLRSTHPPLARLVNAARHHHGRRGFDAANVVAAALGLAPKQVRRVSQSQRLRTTERLLEDWSIGAFSLLDGRRRVRLHSDWHVTPIAIAA